MVDLSHIGLQSTLRFRLNLVLKSIIGLKYELGRVNSEFNYNFDWNGLHGNTF